MHRRQPFPVTDAVVVAENSRLADDDYRVLFGLRTTRPTMFLLPEKPSAVPQDRFVAVDFREGVSPKDLWNALQLFLVLRRNRHRIAVVHFFSSKLFLLGPPIARLAGVRSIVTITGIGRTFSDRRRRAVVVRFAYLSALRLSLSLASRALFQNLGQMEWAGIVAAKHTGKFRYVGSAVDTAAATALTRAHFSGGPLTVLHVARLLACKGIDDFIEVASSLAGEDVQFLLAGPPAKGEPATYERVLAADRAGIIRYLGSLDRQQLAETLSRSHVFLFPSYSEGVARAMLEAGAVGLVPVAYDIDANRELVTREEEGFLLPLHDRQGLTRSIKALSAEPASAFEKGARFRRRVRNDFDIGLYLDRVEGVLHELEQP